MSFIETVKGKVKATTDAVLGKTATVAIETKGKLAADEAIEVILTVKSTGEAFESKGAYVDLHGEDDLEESVIEKVREFVLRKGDPAFSIEVHGPFTLAAGETKTLSGRFIVPQGLDPTRKWVIRGRLQTFGKDPSTPFVPIG